MKNDLNSEKVKLQALLTDMVTLTTKVNATASKTEVVNIIARYYPFPGE